ncbi:MAG: hypothetical protein JSS01_02170 [Proteobacteria bacterium]|nr:hypothetical protein [Pseudomonadota bacterium]
MGEALAGQLPVAHQALEHAPGQQAHVFGKEAEQALGEEVRHRVGRMAAPAQLLGQGGKAARGGFGDVAVGGARAKAGGVKPQAAQQLAFVGLVELVHAHGVGFARVAVELGVDADLEAVAHHQKRRIAQRQAVLLQLAQGGVEVLAGGLVLPGEVVAQKHVGKAARLAQDERLALEHVFAGDLGAAGLGHFEQFAQVQEVALRALLFVQVRAGAAGAPFGDECGGGDHFGCASSGDLR